MPRTRRFITSDAVFHVYNRAKDKKEIFHSSKEYQEFVNLMTTHFKNEGINLFAFCLMPNHYHLMVRSPKKNLSLAVRKIISLYSKFYRRFHPWNGPLFRERFKSRPISDFSDLLGVLRYIHLNPISAGLVLDPENWPWSSHRLYCGKDGNVEFSRPHIKEILEALGDNHEESLRKYKELIASESAHLFLQDF